MNTGLAAGGPRGGGQETKGGRQTTETACCQQRSHSNRGADDCSSTSIIFGLFVITWKFGSSILSNICLCVLQETVFSEQVEGLVEEENEEEDEDAPNDEFDGGAVGAISLAVKKTERQRKKERAEKLKVQEVLITEIILVFWKVMRLFDKVMQQT